MSRSSLRQHTCVKHVNEEAAKTLVIVAPTLKDAALSNPKLDAAWLAESLATNLEQQGAMMERIAPDIRALLQKDGADLEAPVHRLLQDWSHISLEVIATDKSKITVLDLQAKVEGGTIEHVFKA